MGFNSDVQLQNAKKLQTIEQNFIFFSLHQPTVFSRQPLLLRRGNAKLALFVSFIILFVV